MKKHEAAVAALQEQIKAAKDQAAKLADAAATATLDAPSILVAADVPGIVVDEHGRPRRSAQWKQSTYSKRLHRRRLPARRERRQGREDAHLPAGAAQAGPVRGAARLLAGQQPGRRACRSPSSRRRREDGPREPGRDAADRRPVRLARRVPLREERQGFVLVSNEGTKGHVTADAVQFLPLGGDAADKKPAAPAAGAEPRRPSNRSTTCRRRSRAWKRELKQLAEAGPKRPRTMAVREEGKIEDTPVHVRGSVHNLGRAAPRGFLQVRDLRHAAGHPGRRERPPGAGRLDRQPDNPLTARVIVNRVWHWLFGAGSCARRTTSAPPAKRRRTRSCSTTWRCGSSSDGWSVKKLVRADRAVADVSARVDRIGASRRRRTRRTGCLARANRRRLDAECIRDTMLAVSGQLERIDGRADVQAGPGRGLRLQAHGQPPQRLRAGLPQRAAGALRGLRLRRPEHGQRAAQRQHGRPAGAVPDEPPVRPGAGRGTRPAGCWPNRARRRRGRASNGAYRCALGRAPTDGERQIALGVPRRKPPATRRRVGGGGRRRCSRRPISGT